MGLKKQFGKSIAAFVLLTALMLPGAVQFFHMLEGHEHVVCTDKEIHVHQTIEKCEVCSFHFTPFNFDTADFPDLEVPKVFVKRTIDFASLLFHSFKITNTQLRAPPVFS